MKLHASSLKKRLVRTYGCNEIGSCAIKLPGMDNYYINSDTHVLNLIDENGNLSDEGRVIGTTLYKRDFPIINYEIGDTMTSETIDGVRYIKTINGRMNDMVRQQSSGRSRTGSRGSHSSDTSRPLSTRCISCS